MKSVPFFPNTLGNDHCLQSCTKTILSYFVPTHKFSDIQIDSKTGQVGGFTWTPPLVVWLNDLKLNAKLYSTFDYSTFGVYGIDFLRRSWPKSRFDQEKKSGSFKNIKFVQDKAFQMFTHKYWEGRELNIIEIAHFLKNVNGLIIGKTLYELLDGGKNISISQTPHYVVILKESDKDNWVVHDPGLPGVPSRIVPKLYNGNSIFGDIITINS